MEKPPRKNKKEVLVSIGTVSKLFDVSLSTARRMDRNGDLDGARTTRGVHRRYREKELLQQLFVDKSVTTLVYVGKDSVNARSLADLAKEICKRQDWKVRAYIASELWPKRKPSQRETVMRSILMHGPYMRLVLPNRDCAAPFSYQDLRDLCRSIGIEVVVVEREIAASEVKSHVSA